MREPRGRWQRLRLAVLALAAVSVISLACSRLGAPPPNESPAPTPTKASAASSQATATAAPVVTATTTAPAVRTSTPTSTPPATPTSGPSSGVADEPVATLTNPDGPDPNDYPIDGYPFVEVAYELPTYAVLWIDDNQRDVHIALTGGVDEAMDLLRDLVPRGVTVYLHIAEHTQAEVCAVRDEIMNERDKLARVGIVISSGGCGNMQNSAFIGMSPHNSESIAYMRARYDGPVDFEPSGHFALRPVEPPTLDSFTIRGVRGGNELGLWTCGRRPFRSDALTGEAVDLASTGPEVAALNEALAIYVDIYGDLSQLEWTLAERDQFGGTFLADRGDTWLEAQVYAGTDGWAPGMIDYCAPRELTVPDGGNADVYLDPDFPKPRANDTQLHVLVNETGCSGASVPYSRLLPPIVRYDPGELRVEVTIRSPGGPQTCPGNPSSPVTVLLPEPVGDREVKLPERPRY